MPSFDILENAFGPGFTVTQRVDEEDESAGDETLHFYPHVLGMLGLRSGRVVACDALASVHDAPPLVHEFPKGDFPVELAVARYGAGERADERVAFARIRFSEAPPVRWEGTRTDDDDPAEIAADELFGYGVDSGRGAFLDAGSRAEFLNFLENDPDAFEKLEEQFEANFRPSRDWLLWQRKGAAVALFSSGLGDGVFPSLVGYGADGRICRLVTDFGLVEWTYSGPDVASDPE